MADQLYDNPISDATDWGGDASTGNIPVSGRRVQEYIKKRFSDDEVTLDEHGEAIGSLSQRVQSLESNSAYIADAVNAEPILRQQADAEISQRVDTLEQAVGDTGSSLSDRIVAVEQAISDGVGTVKGVNLNGEEVAPDADGIVNLNIDVVQVDDTLDENSTNAVQNALVAARIHELEDSVISSSDVTATDTDITVTLKNRVGGDIATFDIPILSGGGGGDVLEGKNIQLNASLNTPVIKEGEAALVNYTYDTVYVGGDNNGNSTNENANITIEVMRGTVTALRITSTVAPGSYSVDVSKALAAGSNDIRITAEVYDSDTGTTRRKSRTVKLYVSALKLRSSFSLTSVVANGGLSGSVTIPYTITGTGNKTVTLYLDGTPNQTQQQRQSGTRNGEFNLLLTGLGAGSRHTVQLRAEVTIDGVDLISETIYIDILIAGGSNPWAGVMFVRSDGGITTSGDPNIQATQYEPLEVAYAAWSPTALPASVEIRVGQTVLQTVSAYRRAYTYRARYIDTANRSLYFAVGSATSGTACRRLAVTVDPSPIDVGIADGMLRYQLSADGRSNAEANPAQWGAEDGISTTFEGVDWNTSGWTGEALRLINGAVAHVGIKPFATESKLTGATLEMVVKVDNPVIADAEIISCMRNGKGFKVTPSMIAYMTGATVEYTNEDDELKTRDVGLKTNYASGSWLVIALVIGCESDGSPTMELFINGDRVGADLYGAQFNFSQGDNATAPSITFDSSGADIEVKRIRFYQRALSDDEVLDNTIAEQESATKMIEMHESNQVLSETADEDGNSIISMKALTDKGKGVIRIVRLNRLDDVYATNDKNVDFLADVYYTPSAAAAAQGSKPFVLHNCYIRIQGTSSTKYPAKNIRIYINKGDGLVFILDGETISNKNDRKFSLRDGTPAQTVLCAKKDYSDSTMSLNTGGAKLFNDTFKKLGLLTPPQKHQAGVTATSAGDIRLVTVRAAIDGLPIDIFASDTVEGDSVYYGQYNLNNEKSKSGELFGMEGVDGFNPSCPIALESLNNTQDLCLFRCNGNVANKLDAEFDSAFEFNYPEDVFWSQATLTKKGKGSLATAEQRSAVTNLIAFIKACVPSGADSDHIESFVSSKFRAEAAQHFDVSYLITYYLWTDYFLAVDQRAKNILWRTWDGVIWYPTYYDGDTQMGKSNDSYMSYDYATSRTTYDDRMNKYAFEGYDSWLWNLVLANFAAELRTCAMNLRTILTNEVVMDMYANEQMSNWCERVYNKSGYISYIRPAMKTTYGQKWPYIFALQGRNLPHREYMVRNRFAVLDAKYGCGNYRDDNVDFYLSQPDGAVSRFVVAPTEDYAFGWGTNNDPFVWLSDIKGKNDVVNIDISGERAGSDPLRIYGASRMRTFSAAGASGYILNGLLLNKCTSLQELDLSAPSFRVSGSWYFSVDGCRQLRRINLNGQVNACTGSAGSKDIDLTAQSRLEWLDARGVDAYTVEFAPGAPVSEVYMPMSLQNLTLDHLPLLTRDNLHITTLATIKHVNVQGCPGIIDLRGLIVEWLAAKTTPDADCSLTLADINWTNVDSTLVRSLALMKANITGVIDMGGSTMNYELKQLCVETWGDIDSDANALQIRYIKRSLSRVEVIGQKQITRPGQYQFRLSLTPVGANNIKSVRWAGASPMASMNAESGILTVVATGSAEDGPTVNVTATVTCDDDTELTASLEVMLYERPVSIGDFLYADGSTSDEYDPNRTIIGTVFYIDPNRPWLRLACATKIYNCCWGLFYSGNVSDGFPSVSIENDLFYSESNYSRCFDVPTIENKSVEINGFIGDNAVIGTGQIGDYSTYDARSTLGFKSLETELMGHSVGEILPFGLIDTLHIIEHRNRILSNSGVNIPIPESSEGGSLIPVLEALMNQIQIEGGKATFKQYYFPAASYCHSYEPTVQHGETLDEKFKQGNWFLPTAGEIMVLMFFAIKGKADGMPFKNSYDLNLMPFSVFDSKNFWTTTEKTITEVTIARSGNGHLINKNDGFFSKRVYNYAIPCVAF